MAKLNIGQRVYTGQNGVCTIVAGPISYSVGDYYDVREAGGRLVKLFGEGLLPVPYVVHKWQLPNVGSFVRWVVVLEDDCWALASFATEAEALAHAASLNAGREGC